MNNCVQGFVWMEVFICKRNVQECDCWVIRWVHGSLYEKRSNGFLEWLHHFIFSWTIYKVSKFFTSFPTHTFFHFSGYEVISNCGWHFPSDKWYWTSFHLLTRHLYVFFGLVSIQVFFFSFYKLCLFVVGLCLLYIPDIYFANVFSPDLWVSFTFLMSLMFY